MRTLLVLEILQLSWVVLCKLTHVQGYPNGDLRDRKEVRSKHDSSRSLHDRSLKKSEDSDFIFMSDFLKYLTPSVSRRMSAHDKHVQAGRRRVRRRYHAISPTMGFKIKSTPNHAGWNSSILRKSRTHSSVRKVGYKNARRFQRKRLFSFNKTTGNQRTPWKAWLNGTLMKSYAKDRKDHDDEVLTKIVGNILRNKRLRSELLYDLEVYSTGSGLSRMHGSSRNRSTDRNHSLLFTGPNRRRKDYIPKPIRGNLGSFRDTVRKKSAVYLSDRSRQFPETLHNVDIPLKSLYTSLQGLDNKEQKLVSGFLEAERLEEKQEEDKNTNEQADKYDVVSAEDMLSDTPLNEDHVGDLYEDQGMNSYEDPTQQDVTSLRDKENALIAIIYDRLTKEKAKQETIKRLEASRARIHKVVAPIPVSPVVTTKKQISSELQTTENRSASHANTVSTPKVQWHPTLFQDALYDKTADIQEASNRSTNYQSKLKSNLHGGTPSALKQDESRPYSADSDTYFRQEHIHDVSGFKKQLADYHHPIPPPGFTTSVERSHLRKIEVIDDVISDGTSSLTNQSDTTQLQTGTDPHPLPERTETGSKRQNPNEFTFGSKVDISPGTNPGNVKIVHETPPSEFRAAFQTMFQPTRATTVFTPPILPAYHPPNQPLHMDSASQQFPWQWYKNADGDANNYFATHHPGTTRHSPTSTSSHSQSAASTYDLVHSSTVPTTRPSRLSTLAVEQYHAANNEKTSPNTTSSSADKLIPSYDKQAPTNYLNMSLGYADGEVILGNIRPKLNVSEVQLPVNIVHFSDRLNAPKNKSNHHERLPKLIGKVTQDSQTERESRLGGNEQPPSSTSQASGEQPVDMLQKFQSSHVVKETPLRAHESEMKASATESARQDENADNQGSVLQWNNDASPARITSLKLVNLTKSVDIPPHELTESQNDSPELVSSGMGNILKVDNVTDVKPLKVTVKILSQIPLPIDGNSFQTRAEKFTPHDYQEATYEAKGSEIHLEDAKDSSPKPGFELPILGGPKTKDYQSFLPGSTGIFKSKGKLRDASGHVKGSLRHLKVINQFGRFPFQTGSQAIGDPAQGDRRHLTNVEQYSSYTQQETADDLPATGESNADEASHINGETEHLNHDVSHSNRYITSQPSELNDARPTIHFVDYESGRNGNSQEVSIITKDSDHSEADSTVAHIVSGDFYARPEFQLHKFSNSSKPEHTEISASVDGGADLPLISDEQSGALSLQPENTASSSYIVPPERGNPKTDFGSHLNAIPASSPPTLTPATNEKKLVQQQIININPTVMSHVQYPTVNLMEMKKNLQSKLLLFNRLGADATAINHMQQSQSSYSQQATSQRASYVHPTSENAGPYQVNSQSLQVRNQQDTSWSLAPITDALLPPLLENSRKIAASRNNAGSRSPEYLDGASTEQRMYMDDMYWTDSDEEKELACRQEKGTDIVLNILCFGDSLTRGYYNKGKSHHPYTMKLQYLLNQLDPKRCFIVDNEGKDGDLAFGEMPKRIETIFKESGKRFEWVIILGGTNDIYNKKHAGQHTAAEITQNILTVHEIAHRHGSRTIAVTIPEVYCETTDTCQDLKATRETVNDDLRTFAMNNKKNVILCDLAGLLARKKISTALVGQFFEGGLHLKPRGYETMARLIFDVLKTAVD